MGFDGYSGLRLDWISLPASPIKVKLPFVTWPLARAAMFFAKNFVDHTKPLAVTSASIALVVRGFYAIANQYVLMCFAKRATFGRDLTWR